MSLEYEVVYDCRVTVLVCHCVQISILRDRLYLFLQMCLFVYYRVSRSDRFDEREPRDAMVSYHALLPCVLYLCALKMKLFAKCCL